MFFKLDSDWSDSFRIHFLMTEAFSEGKISRYVQIIADNLENRICRWFFLFSFIFDNLSDSPLGVPSRAILLDPVEDEVVPRVGVQLPRLLLQLLHDPPEETELRQ